MWMRKTIVPATSPSVVLAVTSLMLILSFFQSSKCEIRLLRQPDSSLKFRPNISYRGAAYDILTNTTSCWACSRHSANSARADFKEAILEEDKPNCVSVATYIL